MDKKQFNNKIFFLIIILSIVIGLVLANYIEFLANYTVVTCAVIFVIGMFAYHGILQLKEKKQNEIDEDNNEKNDSEKK